MNFGIPDKEQTQIKEAFSSLWEVCGNTWDRLFDDTSEEKIKDLEKQVWDLEGEVQVLSEEREKLEKNK